MMDASLGRKLKSKRKFVRPRTHQQLLEGEATPFRIEPGLITSYAILALLMRSKAARHVANCRPEERWQRKGIVSGDYVYLGVHMAKLHSRSYMQR